MPLLRRSRVSSDPRAFETLRFASVSSSPPHSCFCASPSYFRYWASTFLQANCACSGRDCRTGEHRRGAGVRLVRDCDWLVLSHFLGNLGPLLRRCGFEEGLRIHQFWLDRGHALHRPRRRPHSSRMRIGCSCIPITRLLIRAWQRQPRGRSFVARRAAASALKKIC